jgi:hypothetical protein
VVTPHTVALGRGYESEAERGNLWKGMEILANILANLEWK